MDIRELIIDEETNLIAAMEQLDKSGKKILFVLKAEKLVGTLTDGDIRRFILRKGGLDSQVKHFANYHPHYIFNSDRHKAQNVMKELKISALPIVDKEMKLLTVVFSGDKLVFQRGKTKVPVVIMAGGKGTRLYPYTKILPKPLIPIHDIPITEHIMNRFYENGSEDFYLIVNHKRGMIKAYFNELDADYNINYVDEIQSLGTGGGLSLLKGKINQTFFLSNCDILVEESYADIYNYHKQNKNLITMVCSLKNMKIPYGVIEFTENGRIESMKEKPTVSFFVNTGFYVVEPEVITELKEDQFLDFPDYIENARQRGSKVGIYPISENSWLDMGQFDEMEKMNERLADV